MHMATACVDLQCNKIVSNIYTNIAWKEKVANKRTKLINIVPGHSETKTNLFIYKSTKMDAKSYRITSIHTNYTLYKKSTQSHAIERFCELPKLSYTENSCSNAVMFNVVHSLEIAVAHEAL